MNNLITFVLVALASICISVFITILILKRKYDKRLSDFQDSVLKKQRDEVQNIYQTMRAWRHDYHNHMQAIKALLSMGKKEELSDYLDNLEKDLDCIDIAIRTGNVGLDAILSSKVSIARKNLIDVNCTAKVPQELTVSDVHLCAIVGNLMDNAIEACEKMKKDAPNLPRFIRVYIGLFKSQLYISVINSTKERKRRRVSELVTSKLGEHGFGLRRIDKITEKYDGYVNRKNEPGVFATEVMLPL
ncbi:sensor histidine kinase [Treponema bryantii]|uniref:sensor histidine kinase n=1 Tax=Treponema bryantii TaxID=163 RepID=UPI001C434342|nr:GHKL domain-containing protein [Treponema bryantii]